VIVQVHGDSPTRVQASMTKLVALMAELDPKAQEEFAPEKATRPLVLTLATGVVCPPPPPRLAGLGVAELPQAKRGGQPPPRGWFGHPSIFSSSFFWFLDFFFLSDGGILGIKRADGLNCHNLKVWGIKCHILNFGGKSENE
jgi:hypothetical protein